MLRCTAHPLVVHERVGDADIVGVVPHGHTRPLDERVAKGVGPVIEVSNNSPLSLMVTMTLFGYMAPPVQGDVYVTDVHEIIALTNLSPFHHMQRPFIVKK